MKRHEVTEHERRIRQLEALTGSAQSRNIPSSWAPLTLQNSWVNYGGALQTCGVCKDAGGFVHLRGMIKRTTAGFAGIAITQLPEGFRPSRESSFAVVGYNKFTRIVILADGTTYIDSSDSATPELFLSLDCVTFDTRT
jgi:hypothetical protein